jgi:hypothetical protein
MVVIDWGVKLGRLLYLGEVPRGGCGSGDRKVVSEPLLWGVLGGLAG